MTTAGWGWKLATDPDDVVNFLNGCGPYEHAVEEADITAVAAENYVAFHIFYRPGAATNVPGNWAWKRAADPDDVMAFLNGSGAYCQPVKAARTVSAWQQGRPEFYVFYTAECVPSRIVDCQIHAERTDVSGLARLHVSWRYCATCELPQKLEITVYHEKQHWENMMPNKQQCTVKDPARTTDVEVIVKALPKGAYKIVFCGQYSNHAEIEFAFERLLEV